MRITHMTHSVRDKLIADRVQGINTCNVLCEVCKLDVATEMHHLFSDDRPNKKLYPDFIHDPRNILLVCYDCHHNKPIPKFDEIKFCRVMDILTRSKVNRWRK